MSRRSCRLLWAAFAVCLFAPCHAHAGGASAKLAQALIAGLDYDAARRVLADGDPLDPDVSLERARLAVYELDCDGAATILLRPEVQALPGADALSEIARGCQRVTAALVEDRDVGRGIEVHWQDEHDRALAPLVFDTVAAARDALSLDLATDWPHPTRIVVVRDLLSLSAMTGLPYESAAATGTVAVAKWGRVTLLSPRASPHGFAWRDTLAHELAHLAVTRATRDRAPLWLQEGIAKREEVRWRAPGPFDARPPPDAVVRRGQQLGQFLPLDKLGPSIGMLPNADLAMVAFAEVTSFVRFYIETAGDSGLPKLFLALKDGATPDAALSAATGADLKAWDARWRASLGGPTQASSPLPSALGNDPGNKPRLKDLRDRSRLAELLLSRHHADEAIVELDHVQTAAAAAAHDAWSQTVLDASMRWLRGRALEEAGRRQEGETLVGDPAELPSSYAPWWAIRGRWARLRGDPAEVTRSFGEAVAIDPFDPEGACEAIVDGAGPTNPPATPLCSASRAYPAPPFDSD